MQKKNLQRLVITGQTGTGKTGLALQIARQQNIPILSADSRQIYQEMDIGTGKIDHPSDLTYQQDHWYLQNIPIYGINLIPPTQLYSAGDFADYAKPLLEKYQSLLIVGGTGFYLKSLLLPDQTINIPPNAELRQKWEAYEDKHTLEQFVGYLQQQLTTVWPERLAQMNNSDRNNPRRLLRAIEVKHYLEMNELIDQQPPQSDYDWIALWSPKAALQARITQRVEQMFENGFAEEVESLINKYSKDTPGLQTIGYQEWFGYIAGEYSQEELKQKIITAHLQYARKQMIYLRRFPFIKWFDISQPKALNELLKYCNL